MEAYHGLRGIKLILPRNHFHRVRVTRDTAPIKACINLLPVTDDPEELIACISGRFYPERKIQLKDSTRVFVYAGTNKTRTAGICFGPDKCAEMRASEKPYGFLLEVDANNDGGFYMRVDVILHGKAYPVAPEDAVPGDCPISKEISE